MSMLRCFLATLLLLLPTALWANPIDSCVQITVTVQATAPRIVLSWPADAAATGYTVYRRSPASTSWGTALATLAANATGWSDGTALSGVVYEYKVAKTRSSGVSMGVGYAYSGHNAPLVDARGKLVLVVDATQAAGLATQLARLQSDLVADGWQVIRHDVSRTATVTSVKALIKAAYDADPANVRMVFLVGHVPVPYSGLINPDGHGDHYGAWPADAYYGDMNGTWTDTSANSTAASSTRNHNVPGDGKFDQSTIPGTVMLGVGRVDLSNMPAFTIGETALLARYLDKDHAWRTGQAPAVRKAILRDALGDYAAGAQAGYRNFPPLVGTSTITICDTTVNSWRDPLRGAAAASAHTLWAYACAGSGYTSCGSIISTTDYAAEPYYAVFVMLFGSYHGDWDSGNNVMRAVLANAGAGLSCSWGGRPNYFYHRMGLGEPLGSAPQITMGRNGEFDSTGYSNYYVDGVHLGLMGDPSIRLHPLIPPASATATASAGSATITWGTSPHAGLGYHVYRAASAAGPFTRVSASPVAGTSYVDAAGIGTYTYLVKAVRLETCPSGSYVNASQGAFTPAVTITGGTTAAPVVSSPATAIGTVGVGFSYQITASNAPTSYGASGLPTGLTVNTSTGAIAGAPTAPGTWNASVSASNAGGTGSRTVTITIHPAAPVVGSAGSATGTVGVAFSYLITASNSPTAYGASGLPPGLTVGTSTGAITGSPTTAGTWNTTVSATNATGTGTKVVTITISATAAAPVISSAGTKTGTVGVAFSYQITASGTPTSYGATGLPPGLTVGTATGTITGTPTTAGTWSTTVSATNATGTGTKVVTITIAAPPTITTQPVSRTVTAGQTATFSVVASGSPTLLYQWQRNGVAISGATGASYTTPATTTADSGATFRVVVTNGAGSATSASATLTVNPPADTTPPTIASVLVSRITAHSAEITWTTNEPADSQVQYGTSAAYGSSSPLNPAKVTSHSVTLDGLSKRTTYSFRILSRDAAGNLATYATGPMTIVRADSATPVATSGDLAFTTADEAEGGQRGCGLGAGFALVLAMLALGGWRRAGGRGRR